MFRTIVKWIIDDHATRINLGLTRLEATDVSLMLSALDHWENNGTTILAIPRNIKGKR